MYMYLQWLQPGPIQSPLLVHVLTVITTWAYPVTFTCTCTYSGYNLGLSSHLYMYMYLQWLQPGPIQSPLHVRVLTVVTTWAYPVTFTFTCTYSDYNLGLSSHLYMYMYLQWLQPGPIQSPLHVPVLTVVTTWAYPVTFTFTCTYSGYNLGVSSHLYMYIDTFLHQTTHFHILVLPLAQDKWFSIDLLIYGYYTTI